MSASDDYCELCDLPRSQCIHGQPPPAPTPAATPPPKPRKRPTTKARAATVTAKPVTLRWTPPDVFKPLILVVLEQAGGARGGGELFRARAGGGRGARWRPPTCPASWRRGPRHSCEPRTASPRPRASCAGGTPLVAP